MLQLAQLGRTRLARAAGARARARRGPAARRAGVGRPCPTTAPPSWPAANTGGSSPPIFSTTTWRTLPGTSPASRSSPALFAREFDLRGWIVILVASTVAVDLGFLVFEPQLEWYVGFSGVLHGLMAAGLCAWLWRTPDATHGAGGGPVCAQARLGALRGAAAVHGLDAGGAGHPRGPYLWRDRGRGGGALDPVAAAACGRHRYNRRTASGLAAGRPTGEHCR